LEQSVKSGRRKHTAPNKRLYIQQEGLSYTMGCILGWLLVCKPPH
jgi:hypothetical protein